MRIGWWEGEGQKIPQWLLRQLGTFGEVHRLSDLGCFVRFDAGSEILLLAAGEAELLDLSPVLHPGGDGPKVILFTEHLHLVSRLPLVGVLRARQETEELKRAVLHILSNRSRLNFLGRLEDVRSCSLQDCLRLSALTFPPFLTLREVAMATFMDPSNISHLWNRQRGDPRWSLKDFFDSLLLAWIGEDMRLGRSWTSACKAISLRPQRARAMGNRLLPVADCGVREAVGRWSWARVDRAFRDRFLGRKEQLTLGSALD